MTAGLLTAGSGQSWENDLVAALDKPSAGMSVTGRCVDVAGLLALAGTGQAAVAIGVEQDKMPPGVAHGSTVDLYLTKAGVAGADANATTELIGRDITVQSVAAPSSGGLSGATSNRYQLSVLLAADTADKLVRVLPTGEPIVVLVSGAGG